MKIAKILALLVAGGLILFGAIYIMAAFSPSAQGTPGGLVITGLLLAGMGFGIGFAAIKFMKPPAPVVTQQTTIKIDLPGNVSMDTIKCKSCGGTLSTDNIAMVAGAPVVTCPYCHTSYQLTEEPKW
ncbi:MAG TPA: hypothetical protein PKL11_07390 [Anaerolineaceae bacterium]|jgi:hypothetical protein|nr:hypothetical protein [Anaerolineaceae bacterium]HOG79717.1 hypothetical protein [Anaerolineaceae bacterium]